jgi:hypothetical protein
MTGTETIWTRKSWLVQLWDNTLNQRLNRDIKA